MDGIVTSLQTIHDRIKPEIELRKMQFKGNNTVENIQKEFFFCLLTPQCKARVCWDNIERLSARGILQNSSAEKISQSFSGIRFRNNKARYIVESREKFFNGNSSFLKFLEKQGSESLREYIVSNVKGMGYKEASHFLRNVGKGDELAILDRHILKGLFMAGVISEIPYALSVKRYLGIEESMKKFALHVNIPMFNLDFVFWYFLNREVFK
jgi:N-glycosylase/DNA lyase